jgi:uncharacterized protein YdhG (YjbR/CyaY superfamily)
MRAADQPPKTVVAYIAAAPAPARAMLKALRMAVRSAAPKAEETISYGMPYYRYLGRLVYFAAFKHHVALYVMGEARQVYAKQLEPYRTSMATLRFPIGTRVPAALVSKLIRFRVRENRLAAAKRRKPR